MFCVKPMGDCKVKMREEKGRIKRVGETYRHSNKARVYGETVR